MDSKRSFTLLVAKRNNTIFPFVSIISVKGCRSSGEKITSFKNTSFSQELLRLIFPGRNIYIEDSISHLLTPTQLAEELNALTVLPIRTKSYARWSLFIAYFNNCNAFVVMTYDVDVKCLTRH